MIFIPRPARAIGSWAVSSQQHARRNAMIASTALAQRRAEAAEVEEYLADRAAPPLPAPRTSANAGATAHG
jgi:hypothetical protein